MKFSDDELQHFGRGTKWPQFQIKTQPFCNKLFTDIWYIKLYDEFIYHIWLQQRSWVDNPQSVSQSKRSKSNNMGVVRTSIVRFHMTSRRPYLCTKQWIGGHVCVPKKILWELNSFHMFKLSFIPSNLQNSCCWPRDWKRSIKQPLFKSTRNIAIQLVLQQCCKKRYIEICSPFYGGLSRTCGSLKNYFYRWSMFQDNQITLKNIAWEVTLL